MSKKYPNSLHVIVPRDDNYVEPPAMCGVVHLGGRNQEPLACGLPDGHKEAHSWGCLPTFTAPDGLTKTESAVNEFLKKFNEIGYVTQYRDIQSLRTALEADLVECGIRKAKVDEVVYGVSPLVDVANVIMNPTNGADKP